LRRRSWHEAASLSVRRIPIHVPFAIATETLPCAQLVLVTLSDGEGRVGVGECSPFPGLTGDTIESAERVARQLVDEVRGMAPAAALEALAVRRDEVFAASRTAYVGVETALWDLHARQLRVPLAALWGTAFGESVETDITLPIMPPAAVGAFWERYGGHGFRTVKVKVGGDLGTDLELVHALVRRLPEGTRITLDGNQGYQLHAARALVEQLVAAGIEPLFFEQPLPADDWRGLAALSATCAVPICLDETVASAEAALRAVHERTARIINLKIMKAGIGETLRIAQIAKAGGLELMIGGMLESEIAMGVSLQLAAGTGLVDYADLDTPFFFAEPVAVDSPWAARSATLVCPRGPGHGMTLVGTMATA
jgi:o-succinylbenzoate synthase